MTDKHLSTLIGSRICHDLISPIGAISNGLELLSMANLGNGPEMALIRESVQNAQAKIRFFRIAFGSADTDQIIPRFEVTAILTEISKGGKITYHWDVSRDHTRAETRMAFLLIQCLEAAMPWGGDIHIFADATGWRLHANARKLQMDAQKWQNLQDGQVQDISASQVQFALFSQALSQHGKRLSVENSATEITCCF